MRDYSYYSKRVAPTVAPSENQILFVPTGSDEFQLNCGKLALQDWNKEIAAAARGFEKPRIDPLGFTLHEVSRIPEAESSI
jgi:hypothetical protein